MNAKTLKALKGSIAKWEGIVAGTTEDEGNLNCPLCTLFYRGGCFGCPVMEKTGLDSCNGTPYLEYADGDDLGKDTLLGLAQDELDFLKSLLPAAFADRPSNK
jgi:hypothetical protein